MNASTFPDHKYDFDDAVYLPSVNRNGIVKGIWHREQAWYYRLADEDAWWHEQDLTHGCPTASDAADGVTPSSRSSFPSR